MCLFYGAKKGGIGLIVLVFAFGVEPGKPAISVMLTILAVVVASATLQVSGYYILPTYPSDLAAIQFDRSGTTHIGKYVINHSFIFHGLIGVISSCIFGYILAGLYGYL
ncbi:hypothetical protein CHL10075_08080 [Campylobacter hyointestinalis subsp. lawsonii]|nr:hypothetical protein CHL10075_08080 [Campylobacter hyointestinalis subsp. lawsonii]